jgi:SP family facilitated glucose transporter-like MFS transporter 3
MFDAKNVATAMSIASQVNWACNFLVGIGFPYINDALGPWVFAPFGLVLLLTYMYVLVFLPETAGRTHQEIKRLAGGSVSIDDFEENLQIMVVEGVDLGA